MSQASAGWHKMATSQLLNESLVSQLAKYAYDIGSSYFEDLISSQQLKAIISNNMNGLSHDLVDELKLKHAGDELTEIKHARVCPVCIAEGQFHYQEFQSKKTMVCPIHHCLLVDVCPHCNEALEFDTNLFRGFCTNYRCHAQLEVTKVPSTFIKLSSSQVEDCLNAGLFEKYFEYGQIPVKKSYLVGVSQLALRGYELLTLEADSKPLLQSVSEYYTAASVIPGFIEYLQETMLGSLTSQWLWCDQVFDNNVNRDESGSLDGSLFVGSKQFCHALGLSPETLYSFSDAGLVSVINGTRLNNRSIINIMPFIHHLTSLPPLPNGETFKSFLNSNPGFSLELDELFTAWLCGGFRIGFILNKTLSDSIIVDSDSIRNWMLKNAAKVTKQKLNSREALNVLKTSKRKYLSLISSGALRAVKTESGYVHRFDDVAEVKHQLCPTPQLSFFN